MKNVSFELNLIKAPEPADPALQRLGQGSKGVGIFIAQEDDLPASRQMLNNILRAIGLDMEQDALLYLCPDQTPVHLPAEIRSRKLRYILLFHKNPDQFGIRFRLAPNQPVEHQGALFLLTHTLPELEQERLQEGKALRGALWHVLKHIFTPNT